MVFWIVAIVGALMIGGLLAFALLRARGTEEPPAAYDLRVYRDQLKEIDRDLARGVMNAEDAVRIRAEVSRRILAADAQLREGGATNHQPAGATKTMALVIVLVAAGGTAGLYWKLGAPGFDDMPLQARIDASKEMYETRPNQDTYEATLPDRATNEPTGEYADLIGKLRQAVKDKPDELKGQMLLARNEANLGNVKAAYTAQSNVVRLKGDMAALDDHLFLAELLIAAAEGYVSPEAEIALRNAMEVNPKNKVARYYWGLMLIQNNRPDVAFNVWEQLLREGPADASWIGPIRARIEELAWRAGVDYRLPAEAPTLNGPTSDDVQAAQDLSAEDQQEMIRGMVQNLSERLASEGGSPQEWARLIGAYGVMGDIEQARVIWANAQEVFAQTPEALETVRAGARQAGLIE